MTALSLGDTLRAGEFEVCEEDKALDREIEDADDDERVVDRSGKEVELSKGLEIFWDIATNLL